MPIVKSKELSTKVKLTGSISEDVIQECNAYIKAFNVDTFSTFAEDAIAYALRKMPTVSSKGSQRKVQLKGSITENLMQRCDKFMTDNNITSFSDFMEQSLEYVLKRNIKIEPTVSKKKAALKGAIPESLMRECKEYMKKNSINKISEVAEPAFRYLLTNDKDWIKYKAAKSTKPEVKPEEPETTTTEEK